VRYPTVHSIFESIHFHRILFRQHWTIIGFRSCLNASVHEVSPDSDSPCNDMLLRPCLDHHLWNHPVLTMKNPASVSWQIRDRIEELSSVLMDLKLEPHLEYCYISHMYVACFLQVFKLCLFHS